jgi:thiol-disulfide isomerase/thioredoxin
LLPVPALADALFCRHMATMALSRKFILGLGIGGVAVSAVFAGALMGERAPQVPLHCMAAAALVPRLMPLAKGEMAAFQVATTPRPLPVLSFSGPDGRPLTLADFAGRVTLVNLWATWCIPCRKEMPALDRLQAALGGASFEVVAINIDTRNVERPRQWLGEAGITRLAYYADPKAVVFQELRAAGKATGMPTTLLVDARGCELGLLHGAAEWGGEDAMALIRAAMAP